MKFDMKYRFLIFLLVIFGCETKKAKETVQTKIEIENRKFFVGDINDDKKNDTAFISLKRNIETDEVECGENNCFIKIEFTDRIPRIRFDQSLGIFITPTEDLNNDKANEIIIFSRTSEGYWNNISVWSFKDRKWNEIAKAKAFISESQDFENRIIKERGGYYLIGENQWEEDENGEFKKVKIKI
jgi:hypothetical protein